MKIVGIDIDALQQRAFGLREELAKVESIIAILKESGAEMKVDPAPAPEPAPAPTPVSQPLAIVRSKAGYHQGARKAIAMALHTGPLSLKDLARGLVWETMKVRSSLEPMVRGGYCGVQQDGKYYLTGKGKAMVEWFLHNPTYTIYCPKTATSLQQAAIA